MNRFSTQIAFVPIWVTIVSLLLVAICVTQTSIKVKQVEQRLATIEQLIEISTTDENKPTVEQGDAEEGRFRVVSVIPAPYESAAETDMRVTVLFNKPVALSSLDTKEYRISGSRDDIGFSLTYGNDSSSVVLIPTEPFENAQSYSVLVKASVMSEEGETLNEPYVWGFNTVAVPTFTEGADLIAGMTAGSSDKYLHYVLVVTNRGPQTAQSPILTGLFPPGEFEYTADSDEMRSYCSFPEPGEMLGITCEFPDLEPDAAYDVPVRIKLADDNVNYGLPGVRIEVTSNTLDPDQSNNTMSTF